MKEESYERYWIFFETLASPTRLRIINVLRKGPKNVSEIIEQTGLEQSCGSHCLRKLQTCGFVTVSRKGKFRVYELNHKTIEPLMDLIDEHTQKYCSHLVKKHGA